MRNYNHKDIEAKWQNFWAANRIYTTPDSVPGKDNFFLLVEFPYPSGNLHVGHWYAFAVPDIIARAMRMQGKNVMYPIGFDAFGLPAENAAIKNKLNPRDWTQQNIAYMTKQTESMGTSFDWSRKVSTIDPEYYKWTQWLFLQLYKKGLVYQKETAVNWCPVDKTVLANEQVVDGKCERCGAEVVQKLMVQWNIKITEYADRLVDDLESLDWPQQIKESQKNWIGRSEGAEIDFGLEMGVRMKYLFLHGYTARANAPRNLWYKEHLEQLGHTMAIPELPDTNNPVEENQVAAALASTDLDENTIVVGHSLGAIVAMKALLASGKKIRGLVLIAPAAPPGVPGMGERPFHKTFDWEFDYERLKKLTKYRIVLSDLQETERAPYLRDLAQKLDARLVETNAVKRHFEGDQEPDVLMCMRPTIRVFTTRPDTLFGATYLVLAPEHPMVLQCCASEACTNRTEIERYVNAATKKTELERQTEQKDKTGVKLEGVEAVNPASGERVPLYVADYVLGHYGTGAIMAVPAHDERDYEFAKKFNLPIKEVVEPLVVAKEGVDALKAGLPLEKREVVDCILKSPKDGKYLVIKWKNLPWVTFVTGGTEGESIEVAGIREIQEETGYKNIRYIRSLGGAVNAQFYHVNKKVNRWAHCYGAYFELIDEEKELLSEEEAAKHDVFWLTEDEVEKQLTVTDMKIAWRRLHGREESFTGEGILVNSGEFDGKVSSDVRNQMAEKYGRLKKTYRLRDWIVSRQRYWGVPIPIIHCAKCGAQPVPDDQLPVELPAVDDYLPSGEGKSPLAKVKSFVQTTCPKCGGAAERETDTLDTFVDSSWYFLRYTDPNNSTEFAAHTKQDNWMPVDLYSGGAEHTTMHLLYSRFWHKALFDCGLVADAEPYTRRMNRSLIMGPDGQKMSKSRGNVVDPDEVVERLGADTVRMYLAFIGPYNEVASYPWNPDGVVGVRRFVERVWKLQDKITESDALEKSLHKLIKKVSEDIPLLKFNTAIAAMMSFLNEAEKTGISKEQYSIFVQLLAPFAPHMAEELWQAVLGESKSVHVQKWPSYDESKTVDDTVMMAIQINGKTRGEVSVVADADNSAVEKAARDAVAPRLEGKEIVRTVVVPKRLVNFVVKEQ